MEIKSLSNIEFASIYEAFAKAFSDYEVQQSRQELQSMLTRRGFASELSFAAFDGREIVAFTLNGIGNFDGIKTAYDTGTGTLEQYRGKGLASEIFNYSIPFLKENGVRQYLLEVLQHNTKAVSIYKKLGFKISREFNYFVQYTNEVKDNAKPMDTEFEIRRIGISDIETAGHFCDFNPSWQNSREAIQRSSECFECFGAYANNQIAGYCVFDPNSGDLTQICVRKVFRRKGIASELLRTMLRSNKAPIVKVINNDTTCVALPEFLQSMNIPEKGKQFEMIKVL